MDSTAAQAPSRRAALTAYATGLFTDSHAELLVIVIPLWAIHIGLSPFEIGVIVGARSVLPFFLAIHGGALMDRLGTRRVLIVLAIFCVILPPLYPLATWFWGLLALQLMIGLTNSLAWVGAQTLVCQISGADTTMLGRFAFSARAGVMTAPIIIGAMWDNFGAWGAFPFIGLWGVALLATVLAVPASETDGARIPDTLGKAGGKAGGAAPGVSWRDLMPRLADYRAAFSLMAIPSVLFVVIVSAFRISSANIQSSFYVVYLSGIDLSGTEIGILISASQGMASLGTLSAGKRLRRFDLHWIMLITVSISLFLISITPLLGTAFAVLMIFIGCRGFFQGMSQPVMYSILSTAVGPGNQGTSIGLRSTANRLSSIIFPVAMGAIAEGWGIGTSFLILGAVILAMLGVTGIWLNRGKGFNRAG